MVGTMRRGRLPHPGADRNRRPQVSSVLVIGGLLWSSVACRDCGPRSAPTIDEPGPTESIDHDSILWHALGSVEQVSIPSLGREVNLTTKSSRVAIMARLLAKAGRYEEAVVLAENHGQRVSPAALGEVAVVAIQCGDAAVAERVIRKLSGSSEWTAGGAMAVVATAIYDTGDPKRALALAASIQRPQDKVQALRELVRRSRASGSNVEASRWLREAVRAAIRIPHRMKPGAPRRDGTLVDVLDYSPRQEALLDLIVDLGEVAAFDAAHDALRAMDDVPETANPIFKARALVEIAESRRAAGQAQEEAKLLDQALDLIESFPRLRVGECQKTVEVMLELSRAFARLGKADRARAILTNALAEARRIELAVDRVVVLPFSVGSLTGIARSYLELGMKQKALHVLEHALTLVQRLPLPPQPNQPRTREVPGRPFDAFATPQDRAWNERCAAQETQVVAGAKIAAVLEGAGQGVRAEALWQQAIQQIDDIPCSDWRGRAWNGVVGVHLDAKHPTRALDLLATEKRPSSDQASAWRDVVAALPSTVRLERLPTIVDGGAPVEQKVEVLADLGTELARAGKPREASQRATEALRLIARESPYKNELLQLLASELSFAAQEPNGEQTELLRRIRQ